VAATLPEGAPIELSPLAGPQGIAGGESPLLRPAVGLGAVAAVAAAIGATWLGAGWWRRRPRPETLEPRPQRPAYDLSDAEGAIEHDPVRAYRALALAVRSVLAGRYGFPAGALTTGELQARMERAGVDRWEARLVSGLLEECDAVVYAGYRPAAERRRADLTMAREIVEATG
jgi:hypothetical protein